MGGDGRWGLNRAQKGLNEITEFPTPVPPMGVRIGRLHLVLYVR